MKDQKAGEKPRFHTGFNPGADIMIFGPAEALRSLGIHQARQVRDQVRRIASPVTQIELWYGVRYAAVTKPAERVLRALGQVDARAYDVTAADPIGITLSLHGGKTVDLTLAVPPWQKSAASLPEWHPIIWKHIRRLTEP